MIYLRQKNKCAEMKAMDTIKSNYAPTFLYVDRYHFPNTWVYQENRVPYSLIRYIVRGSAIFCLGEETFRVSADDVFYIPQDSLLSCQALEEIVFISVRFIGSIQLPGIDMLDYLWEVPKCTSFADKQDMKNWFELMYQSAISRQPFKMLEIRGYLNLICAALARSAAARSGIPMPEERKEQTEADFFLESLRRRAEKSTVNVDARIRLVVDYIVSHPEVNLSRAELCAMADVSESTLRRLFKSYTKKTIYEFTKDTKMLYAARHLATSNEPVSAIAYALGFESPSYFGKAFREVFGVSPKKYRKMSQDI